MTEHLRVTEPVVRNSTTHSTTGKLHTSAIILVRELTHAHWTLTLVTTAMKWPNVLVLSFTLRYYVP